MLRLRLWGYAQHERQGWEINNVRSSWALRLHSGQAPRSEVEGRKSEFFSSLLKVPGTSEA